MRVPSGMNMEKTRERLILASRSPRRRAILAALGLEFEAIESGEDEPVDESISPRAHAIQTAAMKADAVASRLAHSEPEPLILAADTIVVLDGKILNKPEDRQDAKRMLRALSGRTHSVITGIALRRKDGPAWLDADETRVTFKVLPEDWIATYVATGSADDKAGAYGVQEMTAKFIERIEGDLSNVIGLPLVKLRRGLAEMLGGDPFAGQSLRAALREAFPGIDALAEAHWVGLPA
jgi:septum formation protein